DDPEIQRHTLAASIRCLSRIFLSTLTNLPNGESSITAVSLDSHSSTSWIFPADIIASFRCNSTQRALSSILSTNPLTPPSLLVAMLPFEGGRDLALFRALRSWITTK